MESKTEKFIGKVIVTIADNKKTNLNYIRVRIEGMESTILLRQVFGDRKEKVDPFYGV